MSLTLFGHTIVILDQDERVKVKSALDAAGISLKAFAGNEVAALWAEVKQKFPETVTAIEGGIKDMTDSSLSGGQKAVKVAEDVLPYFPATIRELANAKDFAVHAVTDVFADTVGELKKDAAALIGTL